MRDIVGSIAHNRDRLVLATNFGIALFDGTKLQRYFVDETASGRLRVAEAMPGLLNQKTGVDQ